MGQPSFHSSALSLPSDLPPARSRGPADTRLPLSSAERLRPKAGTRVCKADRTGKGSEDGEGGWFPRRLPGLGGGGMRQCLGKARSYRLSPAPCALAAGGKAEQRNGILDQLAPVHTCTHIYMHSYHTHVPQAHGHVHTYVHTHIHACTHTHGSFKGLTSSFRIVTLGCSSPAEKEDKGTFPAQSPPPTSREERA